MPRKSYYVPKRDMDPVWKTGARVRITVEALARIPYLPRELGTITQKSPQGRWAAAQDYIYVLWDGCEAAAPYSKSLLELALA